MDGEFVPKSIDEEEIIHTCLEEIAKMEITSRELSELWVMVRKRIRELDNERCKMLCSESGHNCFRKHMRDGLIKLEMFIIFFVYAEEAIEDLRLQHRINNDVARYLRWVSTQDEFGIVFRQLSKKNYTFILFDFFFFYFCFYIIKIFCYKKVVLSFLF
jgi:hypothetical protein